MAIATVLAIAFVIGQGAAVWAFLKFVRSFGAYTASHEKLTVALMYTHESNLAIHEANKQILAKLTDMQARIKTKGVA